MSNKEYQNPDRSKYEDLRKEHIKCSKFPRNIVSKSKKEDLEYELRGIIYADINSFNVDKDLFLNDKFYREWMCYVINFRLEKLDTKLKYNVNLSCNMELIDAICPNTDEHTKQLEDEMRQKVLFDIDENEYSKLIDMKSQIDELISQLPE
jgi:hypothetical protein